MNPIYSGYASTCNKILKYKWHGMVKFLMDLLIVATYAILLGIIAFLLVILASNKNDNGVEVRDNMLAPEELQKHAIEIARNHPVGKSVKSLHWLIRRLNDNYGFILEVYKALNSDFKESFPTAPAAEWLLDNFYIIEEQVKLIRRNLSRGQYSRLPVLKRGYLKGYPRVYAIALEMVAHSDGSIDENTITGFIKAYQSQVLLSMGELWAVPLMLRIALIESIRNTCEEIHSSRMEWHRAEKLAAAIAAREMDEQQIESAIHEALAGVNEIDPSFAEHLVQRMRKYGRNLSKVTALLDTRLKEDNSSTEKITAFEHQQQAAMQVSIGNSITGLRLISDIDWADIFESLSKVEQILRKDTCGIYPLMDFESRDHYRHEVEKLARAYGTSEIHVADKVILCTASDHVKPPRDHVGYYLIGEGRKTLLSLLGKSAPKWWKPSFALVKKPRFLYAWLILMITIFLVSFFMYYADSNIPGGSVVWIVITGLIVFIPCSEFAIQLVHTVLSHVFRPTILPKLELKEGVPSESATFVIIPTLLTGSTRVKGLISQLEVYYLANREENLFYALVGDFKDSDSAVQAADDEIIREAVQGISRLNRKYAAGGPDRFYYMHRKRVYNKAQNRWMGWERKRGAIVEFNRLLRGSSITTFCTITGDVSQLPQIKYIITLDADTSLPMGAAKRLIGTITHPLNKAVVDEESGLVREGHGLLQPRIGVGIPDAGKSLFTRIFAGQGGIDPYTTAISDIYQDIFDEGIFTGKGIYEIDIFLRVLDERIPENTVLSHDLIEGCHLRAGLVSDIELVDGYPARFNSYIARQHRWVRGDWQLLPWLAGRLSCLSKWKIIDNLRRSLLYPSLLLLFFFGMGLLPGNNLVWTGFVLLVTFSPLTMGLLNSLLAGSIKFDSGRNNSTMITGIKAAFYQSVLLFMFMPYQAYVMLDAIIRTIYRVFFSHRNMLEWVTAADIETSIKNNSVSYFQRMWFTIPASLAIIPLALQDSGEMLAVAIPVAILWLIAPLTAYWISKPYEKQQSRLSPGDLDMLRRTARKTWSYFEDFAGENENYLPPDNYQEDPPIGIVHRTSPTNIGLLLTSIQSACDLGYIGMLEMGERFEKILHTLDKLEKWRGHLYNWYHTITLETLKPLYVSTVDSGNLVGCMMVVSKGLEEYLHKPVPRPVMVLGLKDTCALVCEETGNEMDKGICRMFEELESSDVMDIKKWAALLHELDRWLRSLNSTSDSRIPKEDNKNIWGLKLSHMIRKSLQELEWFYPVMLQPELYRVAEELDKDLAESCCRPAAPDELAARYELAIQRLMEFMNKGKNMEKQEEAERLIGLLKQAVDNIDTCKGKYAELIEKFTEFINMTEFSPLFDHKRLLFAIGFNVEDGHQGKSYYDLLASEARQASYIAIARGEVDRKHWNRLGRKLTAADGGKGLVSWTGTMFEYLMPLLIMRNYENSIFDETYSFVVKVQRKYGKQRHIPWGISESGYSAFDFNLNYQYKAFGVPELGLKRGLANDMVTAPYASILAIGIEPGPVADNLKELARMGMDGPWGFYEAIDFTPSRLDRNVQYQIVKSFMAHHQGMSLAALNNFFNSNILQERFHANPIIKSAELLLQERSPEKVLYAKEYRDECPVSYKKTDYGNGEAVRTFGLPDRLPPNAHILSNGSYSVMITDGGSGYSRNEDMAITRWSGDTFENYGSYIFIQNINSNTAWSATYDPLRAEPEKYKVVFSPDKAEFSRRDGSLETYTEVTVSPEDNAEVRRVSITNHSQHVRVVEITSYLEVVLSPAQEDAAHPAFSKLFVNTEFVMEQECLLASRRRRKAGQKSPWLLHTMGVEGNAAIGDVQYETDRMQFIGRNRDLSNPQGLEPDQPLSNSEGSVLDPVMSLRRRVRIEPGQTVRTVFTTAVAHTRKSALELAEKYHDFKTSERAFELSWTRSQVEARYLGLDAREAEFYLELVPLILYTNPLKRKYAGYIHENVGSQSDLWPFGISGDLPVILVEINDNEDMDKVFWALKGHEFWRVKGLITDLVFLINKKEGYSQPLNDQVRNAVAASHARELSDKNGGVFIRNTAVMEPEQIALFYTVAKLVVAESIELLKNDVKAARREAKALLPATACNNLEGVDTVAVHQERTERKLAFYNGIGGFSEDGREYVIRITKDQHTPMPWSNIIAGRNFGFLVTESGGGYTWAENSREYKLTPWYNDPVTDIPGEIFYINDLDNCLQWSMTPRPAGDKEPYIVRHGHGYSIFEHKSFGLAQSLTLFVALDEPVKICLISLTNLTGKARNLSITYYIRPVLGVNDDITSPNIVSSYDDSGLLLIENKVNQEFKGRVAFIYTNIDKHTVTGDRATLFGLKSSLAEPGSLISGSLSGITGAGLDPCGAMSAKISVKPEEEITMVFLFGSAKSAKEASGIVSCFSDPEQAIRELDKVRQHWKEELEAIQIHTPDDSLDVMINGWLMYQTIACRLWARSAYYQAGGAFGFRDQLQDSMAIINTCPELTRSQILLHASRQYKEGDVQHWWHAENGKGIRTRYSDDLLWLAFVAADYLEKTEDYGVMKEQVPFLEGSLLEVNEDEKYEEPVRSSLSASVYEHCTLAIDRSLETGPHGLPLMGSGDWNDGMNTVGNKGRGESVWLGWFLICILNKFAPVCKRMNDVQREERYLDAAEKLRENIEQEAWDGSWYRRAYFDDGTPLGSAQNSECRIDSISQSWSVISEAAKPQRMQEAMDAVLKYLVDRNEGIIKLLTPPFDKGDLSPGYIKGYVPGVRENGGQYTHAATWVVLAFTKLGMGDTASEIFHMLNPINHTRTPIEYSRYKGEPYAIAADVYGEYPHIGRAGWTWYTGAAGWLYKVGIENIAGFKKKGDKLYIEPCIPHSWDKFEIIYRFGKTSYHIEVKNPDRVCSGVAYMAIDGKPHPEGFISLSEDGDYHRVEIVMGEAYNYADKSGVYDMSSNTGNS